MDAGMVGQSLHSSLNHRYLALGTFTWHLSTSPESPVPTFSTEWTVLNAEDIRHAVPKWAQELAQLVFSQWIRVSGKTYVRTNTERFLALRVRVLPDDVGRGKVARTTGKLRGYLRTVLNHINRSSGAWEAPDQHHEFEGYLPKAAEDDSLFYIFNTLPSPQPSPDDIENDFAANAMQDLLDGAHVEDGLQTVLYQYQRRSAAMMIQRETQPALELDHRLETWLGPTGQEFYLDRDKCEILSEKRLYHATRGGILAETMGYGKTLICLAAILATKAYIPEVPPGQQAIFPDVQNQTKPSSLADLCALTIAKNGLQWRAHFQEQAKRGKHYRRCVELLDHAIGRYAVEVVKRRTRRDEAKPPELEMAFIASTTLIVVPPNLLEQWRREIHQHLRPDALSILILDNSSAPMPAGAALRSYDIVLLSGSRFEDELFPTGSNTFDLPNWYGCCCSNPARRRLCIDHPYRSPLRDVHFLRIIVDEGQRFVSTSTTQAIQGLRCIKVERKWIVSGTPAAGLVGAEVDLAAEESFAKLRGWREVKEDELISCETPNSDSTSESCASSKIRKRLADRKRANDFREERKALERLGHIVKSFLGVQPWATEDTLDSASWNTYVLPLKDGKRKPLSLENVLASLVVRHRYEDVEAELPPLNNRLVYLKPCYHDKLSINLFIFSLTSNAVTSERTDQDYMFHHRNRKFLEALIKNLRHAGFAWSGFEPKDIEHTCEVSRKYLEAPDKAISDQDRADLQDGLRIGDLALESSVWRGFHEQREIGLYVSNFPRTEGNKWAFCPDAEGPIDLLLTSLSRLNEAQGVVEAELYAPTFTKIVSSLEKGWGSPANTASRLLNATSPSESSRKSAPSSKGIPQSGLQESKKLTGSQFLNIASRSRPQPSNSGAVGPSGRHHSQETPSQKSALKRITRKPEIPELYPEISRTRLIGTSSAKLSYLIDKISLLYKEEKVLVFYEGDDIAYYCAQALELLGIPHLIYASGITQHLRNEYQSIFNSSETYRVLLMDLKQAALGLHMASASRVFFINPVWQPTVEAQAIKRAHRIGQTKPVFVETLVLEGTIEDEMLQRRKNMTVEEHKKAARSLLDDGRMKDLIQRAKLLSISPHEVNDMSNQLAPLQQPQQVFGRSLLDVYGSPEAVTHAWRLTHGGVIHDGTLDNEEMITQNPRIGESGPIDQVTTSPPLTPASVMTVPDEFNQRSAAHRSKKRKLIFVDELEQRKMSTAKKAAKSSDVVNVMTYSNNPTNESQWRPVKELRARMVHFADEQGLPLSVTVFLPKESVSPEPSTENEIHME